MYAEHYELAEYLLTCNGEWKYMRHMSATIPTNAVRATVEPAKEEQPHIVKLSGRTDTSWASSRGRIRWAETIADGRSPYVLHSSIQDRCDRWNGNGPGHSDKTANSSALYAAINPHPSVSLTTATAGLRQNRWLPAVKNFAWECMAGALLPGHAYTAGRCNDCPMCGKAEQSTYHEIAECETLAAARQWLLTVCAKIHSLQPVTASMVPDFVLLGQHKSLHRRRDATAIRGCFFGQWKSQRNLAIKGYARNTTQVCDSLNKRLQAVILRDWVRRRGRGTFAKRWHPFVIVRPGGPEFHNLPSVRDGSVL
jgi:hypothetical protein